MQNLSEIIQDAEKNNSAIGHFNIASLEQLKAIADVAQKLNVPVVIGVSEGEREYLGVYQVVDLVKNYNREYVHSRNEGARDEYGFQLFLNADHTHSIEKAREAAEAGFDAILCDFGKLSFEENIEQTKEAVRVIKSINENILVEGELGYIGGASEIRSGIPEGAAMSEKDFTTSHDAQKFVEMTGVDMLAPAVGNIHGKMKDVPEPRLDIARIRAIKEAMKAPLVLHGASGNTDEDIREAIEAGISLVHISTELRVAWRKGIEEGLRDHPNEVAPYKIIPEALHEMEYVVEHYLRLFGKIEK